MAPGFRTCCSQNLAAAVHTSETSPRRCSTAAITGFPHVGQFFILNYPIRYVRGESSDRGELRQQGQKVKLQEQPFQVLTALLERPGELVTREELRSKLWPAETFLDFDHSLNAAIKRLRDALGESENAPVLIETLARRGYRFIAPVNSSPRISLVSTYS